MQSHKRPKIGPICKRIAKLGEMDLKNYVHYLATQGRSSFTEDEALKETKLSKIALKSAIKRLKKKQEIASPLQGFFIIVPPEYESLQSLPPEQFIDELMRHLKMPYYVGLISAAQFYGAAHQKPQTFQVVIPKARRDLQIGRVKISFTCKSGAEQSAVRQFNTPRGFVWVADPATLAVDLVLFPQKAGGISAVCEILSDLSEHLNIEFVKKEISQVKHAPHLQRLGYFFEMLNLEELAQLCEEQLKKQIYVRKALLDPQEKPEGASLNSRWRLIINTELEA